MKLNCLYAFVFAKQQLHSRYVLQLLLETWKLLRVLPNINRISTCHSKEITICGEKTCISVLLRNVCVVNSFCLLTALNLSRGLTWTVRGLTSCILQSKYSVLTDKVQHRKTFTLYCLIDGLAQSDFNQDFYYCSFQH